MLVLNDELNDLVHCHRIKDDYHGAELKVNFQLDFHGL